MSNSSLLFKNLKKENKILAISFQNLRFLIQPLDFRATFVELSIFQITDKNYGQIFAFLSKGFRQQKTRKNPETLFNKNITLEHNLKIPKLTWFAICSAFCYRHGQVFSSASTKSVCLSLNRVSFVLSVHPPSIPCIDWCCDAAWRYPVYTQKRETKKRNNLETRVHTDFELQNYRSSRMTTTTATKV